MTLAAIFSVMKQESIKSVSKSFQQFGDQQNQHKRISVSSAQSLTFPKYFCKLSLFFSFWNKANFNHEHTESLAYLPPHIEKFGTEEHDNRP